VKSDDIIATVYRCNRPKYTTDQTIPLRLNGLLYRVVQKRIPSFIFGITSVN